MKWRGNYFKISAIFFLSSTTSVFTQMTGKEMMVATVRDHHPSHVLLHLSSGHAKSLLEVFSTFITDKLITELARVLGEESRFKPQISQPCPCTHSLFSLSWLNPSAKDCAHNKHRSTQIWAKYFKCPCWTAYPQNSAWIPDSLKLWQKTWGCLLNVHYAGTRYNIECVPLSPPSPLCCAFFLAETTLCYRSR